MAVGPLNKIVEHLRSVLLKQESAGMDGDLLTHFVQRRDEAAFEALVNRHGPMVMGVCCRVLHNPHDAEDAFQATFLVFVRKASNLRSPNQVGNWLYGVAYRTALEARKAAVKRRAKEASVIPHEETPKDTWDDLRPLLDQELTRLPVKYRTVIVHCDLEGKTRREVADQLGWPEGTVASRLATARTMLAKRLSRHGLGISGAVLATMLSENASTSVPTLVSATVKAATRFAAGQAAEIPASIVLLAERVGQTMLLTKCKMVLGVSVLLLTSILGVYGVIALVRHEAKQVLVQGGPNPEPILADRTVEVKEGQRPEVRLRTPMQIAVVPHEDFTGRLDAPDGDRIGLTFELDERSYLRYQRLLRQHQVKGPDSPLSVGLADEEGFPQQGTLKGFQDQINPTTGTVRAQGSLPNPDRLLLPGMFVRVRMPFGPPQKVLAVPDATVLSDQGIPYLLVVNDKDIVERRDVSLGRVEGKMRIIEKGLGPTDWIVVGDSRNLMPGTQVIPRKETAIKDRDADPLPKD